MANKLAPSLSLGIASRFRARKEPMRSRPPLRTTDPKSPPISRWSYTRHARLGSTSYSCPLNRRRTESWRGHRVLEGLRATRVRTMDWDYAIIGSGFGGSVSGLRLTQKGYRVVMLEKGRRFRAEDFPRSNWNLRRWLWMPAAGFRGIFKMTFLRHVTLLSWVGVAGASLVYAQTWPTPKDEFFTLPSWGQLADWKKELEPHYATALRMLGATQYPLDTYSDQVLRAISNDLGRPEQIVPARVAVYFGEPGKTVPDPYLGGEGPDRTGCIQCGACMTGCRHNAKNTLDKNYLWLAEKRGLRIEADTEVTWVRELEGGGYQLAATSGTGWLGKRRRTFTARNVIFAGGVLGTVPLLLKLKASAEGLPRPSGRVGAFVRTNSESLIGVTTRADRHLSESIAITNVLLTDEHSHLEPVR